MKPVAPPASAPADRRRRRWRRANLLPYALIAPIALLLLAISVYPSLYAIWLATTDASLPPPFARAQFIGIGNFVRLAGDPVFLDSLWRTLRWDVAVVGSELLIALPIALFLNLTFRGRGFVRVAMMIPYIHRLVVALLFAYMFDGNFGAVNDILVKLGILDRYVSWLSDPTGSFAVTVAAMVWYGQPLMALILLAALQTIPQALYLRRRQCRRRQRVAACSATSRCLI